jgi:uncharacterized protein (DUF488 family)
MIVWTIGHSTHEPDEFVELLRAHGIERLVDVRSIPGSRKFPQFNSESMEQWLSEFGYMRVPDLGGRRNKQPIDPDVNAGWRNASFKNYADYMQSDKFDKGLTTLQMLASNECTAFMCSEAVPWRCHRSLISDALTARDWRVRHITNTGPTTLHELGGWGAKPKVQNGKITYPKEVQNAA